MKWRNGIVVVALMATQAIAYDAAHWRGPGQDGVFPDTGLPESWSPDGSNLKWKAPYGSRSSPLIMDGHVYLINRAGEGVHLQERVMSLDLDTGKLLWEHRFNVFLTDIVAHRLGWANLAGDPATGYVYAHGVQGEFFCFDRDGNIVWSRSLTEEFGRISGYGGRTGSPTVEGDFVLIDFLNSSWGPQGRGLHRFLAMDKQTGEVMWWSEPSDVPEDTTYSVPVVATIDGMRVLFTGLADGAVVAIDPITGERRWQFKFSKRGINSSVVYGEGKVYASHSEENMDTADMGSVICLDARTGSLVWRKDGISAGYASPILHDGLLYVSDNSANLRCLDAKTGEEYWTFNYGNEAKGSPVYADGKVYVGEVGGAYHILKVSKQRCEPLHSVAFREDNGAPVEVFGTPAVAAGRVILPTRTDVFCISTDTPGETVSAPEPERILARSGRMEQPVRIQLKPAETWTSPGKPIPFRVTALDNVGRSTKFGGAEFELKGLKGTITKDGLFTPDPDAGMQAGTITAKAIPQLESSARVRVIPPLPYKEDFESLPVGAAPPGWITSPLKSQVVEMDGGKVLKKLAERPAPPFARLRCYMMPPIDAGYTVQADLMGLAKNNRFLPDMGLINSRYLLILTGTSERTRKLRLVSWSPIPRIQLDVDFPWDPDTWYTAKLSVDQEDGTGIVRAKVWPRGTDEPEKWTALMKDPSPNAAGSPGLYAYSVAITSKSKGTEVFFDNVEVMENE